MSPGPPRDENAPENRHSRQTLRSLGGTVLVAAVGFALARGVWTLVAPSDEQNAKLAAGTMIALTSVCILYRLQRLSKRAGHRWAVPTAVATGLVLLNVAFKFDGFSGEMSPLIRWRWAGTGRAWETVDPPSPARIPVEDGHSRGEPIKSKTAALPLSRVQPRQWDESTSLAESRQFLGPNRDGVLTNRAFAVPRSLDDVEVLWDIGIGGGWSSFAIANSLAVTLEQRDYQECLTAYDLETGSLRWIIKHPGNHYNPLGGGGPRSTPTISGDRVVAQSATGWVVCAELVSGEKVWEADLVKLANEGSDESWDLDDSEEAITWGRSGSPLVIPGSTGVTEVSVQPDSASDSATRSRGDFHDNVTSQLGDQVILPFGGPESNASSSGGPGRSLISFALADGSVRWTTGDDQISYASPVWMSFEGVKQIVSVNEATVSGHDPVNGDRLWSMDWMGQTNGGASCSSVVPAGENRFLIGKGYSGGSSLVSVSRARSNEVNDTNDRNGDDRTASWVTNEIWHAHNLLQTKFNHSLVVLEPPTAFAIGNGSLEAVDLIAPRRLWRQPRSQRSGQGQALLVDDILVVQRETGSVQFVAADPTEYRLIAEIPALDNKTWNLPTIAGRYLLVRNDRQAIAMKLKKK